MTHGPAHWLSHFNGLRRSEWAAKNRNEWKHRTHPQENDPHRTRALTHKANSEERPPQKPIANRPAKVHVMGNTTHAHISPCARGLLPLHMAFLPSGRPSFDLDLGRCSREKFKWADATDLKPLLHDSKLTALFYFKNMRLPWLAPLSLISPNFFFLEHSTSEQMAPSCCALSPHVQHGAIYCNEDLGKLFFHQER